MLENRLETNYNAGDCKILLSLNATLVVLMSKTIQLSNRHKFLEVRHAGLIT